MLELRRLTDHYRQCCEALQELGESGVLFKKSTFKEKPLLEFAPVNLHLQEMKVAEEGIGQKGVEGGGIQWGQPYSSTSLEKSNGS